MPIRSPGLHLLYFTKLLACFYVPQVYLACFAQLMTSSTPGACIVFWVANQKDTSRSIPAWFSHLEPCGVSLRFHYPFNPVMDIPSHKTEHPTNAAKMLTKMKSRSVQGQAVSPANTAFLSSQHLQSRSRRSRVQGQPQLLSDLGKFLSVT